MRSRREFPRRREKPTMLIVGEGQQTEPNYFHGLKREDAVRGRFALTVKRGPGHSPEAVVRTALDLMKGAAQRKDNYDQVWCVLDIEGLQKRQSLVAAIALAERNGIHLCLSNPSFEVWLLAHFERRAGHFLHGDAVVTELNKAWQKHLGRDYEKNDEHLYRRISDRTTVAITNARSVLETDHRNKPCIEANSSTEVYKLVKRLLGQ